MSTEACKSGRWCSGLWNSSSLATRTNLRVTVFFLDPVQHSLESLFKALDEDMDGSVSRDEFVNRGKDLAPVVAEHELSHVFDSLDVEKHGFLNPLMFTSISRGLCFRSTIVDKSGRDALLRLSLEAPETSSSLRAIHRGWVHRNVGRLQTAVREHQRRKIEKMMEDLAGGDGRLESARGSEGPEEQVLAQAKTTNIRCGTEPSECKTCLCA